MARRSARVRLRKGIGGRGTKPSWAILTDPYNRGLALLNHEHRRLVGVVIAEATNAQRPPPKRDLVPPERRVPGDAPGGVAIELKAEPVPRLQVGLPGGVYSGEAGWCS